MSLLRAQPSQTNMHTCKDEPFRTTPTSVLLMKPMNFRYFLCTGFLGVWKLSVQNFGGQTDLGTRSVDVRGLSSVDVRVFMTGQLPKISPSQCLSVPRPLHDHTLDNFFPKKTDVSIGCLSSRSTSNKSLSKPNGSKRKPEPELTKVQVPGS